MLAAWLKGLKGAEKEARQKEVLSYRNAFSALSEMIDANLVKRDADRSYSDGWMQRQIAINEYNAAIADIKKLIDLNHKEK
jgi:hypothetical protein